MVNCDEKLHWKSYIYGINPEIIPGIVYVAKHTHSQRSKGAQDVKICTFNSLF